MLGEMSQVVTEQANLGARMPLVGAALDVWRLRLVHFSAHCTARGLCRGPVTGSAGIKALRKLGNCLSASLVNAGTNVSALDRLSPFFAVVHLIVVACRSCP
jgi:hypothetical protein